MVIQETTVRETVARALTGEGAHIEAHVVLEGLDWQLAGSRPAGSPHSIHEIVNHLIYWNDWVTRWLEGMAPSIPEHAAESWPAAAAPTDERAWASTVRRFASTLEDLRKAIRAKDLFTASVSQNAEKTRLEMLHTIASHNSYHLGQIVLLRRQISTWPPPAGGLTW
jgi:uncharacterized damage-inducible protein DinB